MPGLLFPVYRLALIGAGLATALALYLLINHTRVGMLVRAGATNAAMVSALGVDIRRLFMLVFGFGAMLAGFAGALVAPILSVEPGMGDNLLILAFVVIVIGGIGSIRGAFLAALMVGLIDTLGRAFGPADAASRARSRGREPDRARAGADADLHPDGRRAFPASFRPLPGQAMTARGQTPAVLLFAGLALFPFAARFGAEAYLLSLGARTLILALAALSLDFLRRPGRSRFLRPRRLPRDRRLCGGAGLDGGDRRSHRAGAGRRRGRRPLRRADRLGLAARERGLLHHEHARLRADALFPVRVALGPRRRRRLHAFEPQPPVRRAAL